MTDRGEIAGVENPVKNYAKKQGYLVRKLKWIGRIGAPDDFFSKKGKGVFLIEFKAPGKDLRPTQKREIQRLRDAGVTVHVIDNVAAGHALFT